MSVAGKRVLVTRAAEDCERWAEALRERGAEPVVFSCVQTEALEPARLRDQLAALRGFDWWWFTSRRGVQAVAELGDDWPAVRLATVGPATAASLEGMGARAEFVGSGAGAGSLAREWLSAQPEGRAGSVVILAADRAGQQADRVLREAGVSIRRLSVYRTLPRHGDQAPARLDVDLVLVASPSAVVGLRASATLPADVPVISIGPRTSEAVREAGWRLAGEAAQPNLEGMLESLR